jgi:hypothetical protein
MRPSYLRAPLVKLSLFLALIVFTAFLGQVAVAKATSEPIVEVEPHGGSAYVGETFAINITVVNVQNLYALEVTLYWNASILQEKSIDLRLGCESHPDGVLHEPYFIVENSTTQGQYSLAATSEAPAPTFNGTGNIVRITFSIIGPGNCSLSLESQLYNYQIQPIIQQPISNPIDHTTIGGFLEALVQRGNYTSGSLVSGLTHLHPSNTANSSAYGIEFSVSTSCKITEAIFDVSKYYGNSIPSGLCYAVLYLASGGVPVAPALAWSVGWNCSVETTSWTWIDFIFNSANQYELAANTSYFIVFQAPYSGTCDSNHQINFLYSSGSGYTSAYYYSSAWRSAPSIVINYQIKGITYSSAGERLETTSGMGSGATGNGWLFALLDGHWGVQEGWASDTGYGGDFYVPSSFYISRVTLNLFRTNGTDNGAFTVTANMTVDIFASTNQTFTGLPVGVPLVVSNPVNASTISASGYQVNGYYTGATQFVNFTFTKPFLLQVGYYCLALEISNNGKIYGDNAGLYGMIGIMDWNTTVPSYLPMINSAVVNGVSDYRWGLDYPGFDCEMQMAVFGHYTEESNQSTYFFIIVIVALTILAVLALLFLRKFLLKRGLTVDS